MHLQPYINLSRIITVVALLVSVAACQTGPNKFHADGITIHRLTQKVAHIYLVETAAGNLLVDTGFESSHKAIVAWLDSLNIPVDSIRAIVLTHAHTDHAGSATHLQTQLGNSHLPVFIGHKDKADFESGRSRSAHARYWFAKPLESSGNADDYPPLTSTQAIEDATLLSQYLKDPVMPGELIPIPGHTPGSMVLVVGPFALMGDTVMGGVFSDTARDPLFLDEANIGDYKALLKRKIVDKYPQINTFLPGHLRPISKAALRRYTLPTE